MAKQPTKKTASKKIATKKVPAKKSAIVACRYSLAERIARSCVTKKMTLHRRSTIHNYQHY